MADGNCHHLLNSLSGYLDGELSDELCNEIRRHLDGCENCRVVVDTLRQTIELYHTTAHTAEMPADVRERLYRRLELKDYLKT